MKLALTLIAAIAALLLPEAAQACSVCGPGTEESRAAFIITTGILTALPLLLIGGALWWLRGRIADMEERSRQARRSAVIRNGTG